MGDELSLFAARAARDVGMERAAATAANCDLMNAAFDVLWDLVQRQRFITSDDVWAGLNAEDIPAGNPTVMGVVFKDAQRAGLIVPTGDFKTSARVSAHARPVRVWESKRFQERE